MIAWILNYGNKCNDEKESEHQAQQQYETDLKYWRMYYDAEGDKIPREWLEKNKLI